ncbi:hypothetical protein [Mesorhizobium sp.]|uniref:hypothetical protein n=1 Tax=Mesorhizobium sp. TaxID=1871066 RepID=UPI0025D662E9|nr:hypothetical protein [Mesorhizobium sp.]
MKSRKPTSFLVKEMFPAPRRWIADEFEGRSLPAGGQDRHPSATAKTTLARGSREFFFGWR